MSKSSNVRVTFRSSNEKLTSMFTKIYSSISAAKNDIEADAIVWCNAHNGEMKWVNPKEEDYLEAVSKDENLSCVWQYFAEVNF